MVLQEVIEAQETSQDDDDLRFSPEGWARFQVLMAQADESIVAGKTPKETIRNDLWLTASAIGL